MRRCGGTLHASRRSQSPVCLQAQRRCPLLGEFYSPVHPFLLSWCAASQDFFPPRNGVDVFTSSLVGEWLADVSFLLFLVGCACEVVRECPTTSDTRHSC